MRLPCPTRTSRNRSGTPKSGCRFGSCLWTSPFNLRTSVEDAKPMAASSETLPSLFLCTGAFEGTLGAATYHWWAAAGSGSSGALGRGLLRPWNQCTLPSTEA